MPVRHLVLLRFLPSVNPLTAEATLTNMKAVCSQETALLHYSLHQQLNPPPPSTPPPFHWLIDSTFTCVEGVQQHNNLQAYHAVIRNLLLPSVDDYIVLDIQEHGEGWDRPKGVRRLLVWKARGAAEEEAVREVRGKMEELKTRVPALTISGGQHQQGSKLYAGYIDNTKGYTDVLEFGVGDEEGLRQLSELGEYEKCLQLLKEKVDGLVTFDYED